MRGDEIVYCVQGGTNQNVAIGAASVATANATNANTRILRIAATADTYIEFGATPTATTSSPILPAGVIEYVIVHGAIKVACLQVSTGGFLSVTEVAK